MKIKNNAVSNQSVFSAIKNGLQEREVLTIPAGATVELKDAEWNEKFAKECKSLIAAGVLEITVKPKKSAAQKKKEEDEAVAAAKALLKEKGIKV